MNKENGRPEIETTAVNCDADSTSVEGIHDKNPLPLLRPVPRGGRGELRAHHYESLRSSGISDEVIDARGFRSLARTHTDRTPERTLKSLGFAKGLYEDAYRYPGLLIPLWDALGHRTSAQYRPDKPRKNNAGKPRKYEAVVGRPSILDVHPLNRSKIADPSVPLWVTEGVKKGDALTSAGECAVSLAGVFNWRRPLGTLGDWEDVPLRGRRVYVAFDSDVHTNRNVARAMRRLGAWLRSRGAIVFYVVPPELFRDSGGKTGVDDYLGRGHPLQALIDSATRKAPDPDAGDDSLTDSRLAERVADDVLAEDFRYVRGLGWLQYDGTVWQDCGEERPKEEVRQYFRKMLRDAIEAGADAGQQAKFLTLQSAGKIAAVTGLTRGMDAVRARVEEFDADPWLLNCSNGVVDLRTGALIDHDPGLLMRHKTSVAYRPGATHLDWTVALDALPDDDTRAWVQVYLGSGATGHMLLEDILTFWQGGGSNGKSTVLGAVQAALGDYARMLLPSMVGSRRDEHPTEFMDLMGTRLAFLEETGEGHRLDTVKMKKFIGTEKITARRMRRDSVSFSPCHTLVITTNYRPVVSDTDHGTWRRLRMVPFPKTYGRDGLNADKGLRGRLMSRRDQQEAVLVWLVQGAMSWSDNQRQLPAEPASVVEATQGWRESTDLIYAFASERLKATDAAHTIDAERLREEFNDWLPRPHNDWGRQTFAERFSDHEALRAMGATRGKHPKTRRSCFFGVTLKIE